MHSDQTLIVASDHHLARIDRYLSDQFPHYSRSFFKRLIDDQHVIVNGTPITKQSTAVKTDDSVRIVFPTLPAPTDIQELPEHLVVDLVHTHDHFLMISKPAGLLTHKPNERSTLPTLVDWLLAKFATIAAVGYSDRPGIVHRLDKETSGLMVVSRTNYGHTVLADLFKSRMMKKTYLAVVKGHPDKQGTINLPIGRHPVSRNKMTTFPEYVNTATSQINKAIRHAITHYKVLEYFDGCALVQAKPVTGRTHQIRVHFAAIGHALIGDPVYGHTSQQIKRHALHAAELSFTFDDKPFTFTQQLPADMQALIAAQKPLESA